MVANARAIDSRDTRSISTIVLSPPCSTMAFCSAAALAAWRVVRTTRKPSWANFWAMAPPTPQRIPTGKSLSSSALPCASRVLRPSACHLEVAPTTTATGLRAELMRRLARWSWPALHLQDGGERLHQRLQLGVPHRRRQTPQPGGRHQHAMLHQASHDADQTLALGGRGARAPIVGQLAVHRVEPEQRSQSGHAAPHAGALEAVVEAGP